MIYQKISPHLVFNIPIYEKRLTNEIKKGFIKDFNLFEGSLFRFELYYYHDEVSLLMDIHHILIDNYGVEIFLNDLLDIYDNKKINSKKFNYYDYSTEICDKKWKDETIKESKYFEKQLRKSSYKYLNDHYLNKKNSNNINKMDYNKSPSVVRDFHRIMLHFKGNFKKLSKKYNVSINQMILSAIIFSLGKMFDIDCLLINTTVDGRNSPKYYNTIGYFPYILPIFLNTNHETPMEYFNEVKKQTNIVMENYSPYFYPKKSDPLIIYNPTNLYKSNRFIKEGLESSLEELFPHIFSNSHVQYLYFLAALSDDEISLFLYFNTNYYSDNEIKELFKDINDFIGKIADGDEEIISKLYFSECDLLVNK